MVVVANLDKNSKLDYYYYKTTKYTIFFDLVGKERKSEVK